MEGLSLAMFRARSAARNVEPMPVRPVLKLVERQPVEFHVHRPTPYDLKTIVEILNDYPEQLSTSVDRSVSNYVERPKPRPTIASIQALVRATYNITVCEMLGASKCKRLVRTRHIAMYLCCRHTLLSLPAIGRHFGNRDHTTIMSARNNVAEKRLTDEKLDAELNYLKALLELA